MPDRYAPAIDLTTPEGRASVPRWLAAVGHPYRANRAEGLLHDAVQLLARLDKPHAIHVREDGWEIQHAIACRDDMLGCPFHVAVVEAQWDGPPSPPGRYLLGVDRTGQVVIGDAVAP